MKRVLALCLSLLLVVSVFGCGAWAAEAEGSEALIRVGISWAMDEEDAAQDEDIQAYVVSILLTGGEPVYMPQATDLESAKEYLADVDCIIMAGGEDVNPALYGEEMDAECEEPYDERDISDYCYIQAAIELDMPLLATCRGMQMLNVVCGGTLYQDLFTQYDTDIDHRDPELEDFTYHTVTVQDGNILADAMGGAGEYTVNSWHHQGVKDVGDKLTVVALAEDGMVEGMIYTEATYIYGVQFHPEWHVVEETLDCLPVFEALMAAAQ